MNGAKSAMLGAFSGGVAVGLALGYVIGEARARARRAWRDFKATKEAVRGLFRLATGETWRAFRAGAVVVLILGVTAWLVISNIT